ncbi:unnamed protein product, partial [Ectocarpus sp. 12 AP-2014]
MSKRNALGEEKYSTNIVRRGPASSTRCTAGVPRGCARLHHWVPQLSSASRCTIFVQARDPRVVVIFMPVVYACIHSTHSFLTICSVIPYHILYHERTGPGLPA